MGCSPHRHSSYSSLLYAHDTKCRETGNKRNLMKIYLCLALSLFIAGCGALASLSLTQANLDKVQGDMSPADVKAILGDPADSKTEPIPIVGGTQTTYTYHSGSSDVTIVFKNDLMKEKHGTFSQ
jgi:hypothetical protein